MYRTTIPKSPGIYLILSKETDRKYVGSSIDLRRRENDHFKAFDKGNHDNDFLQNHVNKYGVDDLKFVVVELCLPENLIELEQHYIDSLLPAFNFCPIAYSVLGTHYTDETKKRLSEQRKVWFQTEGGLKQKKQISEQMKAWWRTEEGLKQKEQNSEQMKVFYQTEEGIKYKKQMSEAATGRIPSDETRKKLSEANIGRIGWIPSAATRKKLSEARIGRTHSEETKKKMRTAAKIASVRRRKRQQFLNHSTPEERLLHEEIQDWILDQLKDRSVRSNTLFAHGKEQDYSEDQIRWALYKIGVINSHGDWRLKKPEEHILEREIEDWVLDRLKDGWVASNDLYAWGKQEEYSQNQIRDALHRVRVNARKKLHGCDVDGQWGWKLKKEMAEYRKRQNETNV